MGEGDAGFGRWLWALRLAVLASSALALGPIFPGPPGNPEIVVPVFLVLLPSVALQLLAILVSRQRPWLAVAAVNSALVFTFTVSVGRGALGDVPYEGWRPVVWAGLVALCQLTIALAAVRAWFLAPSGEPAHYVWAFGEALAVFAVWLTLVPPIGLPRVSANEAAAIGDVRSVLSAQSAYASATGGCYGDMPCLSQPTVCIPNYAANAPTFLGAELSSLAVKNGYRRNFVPGPAAKSPRCFEAYAYTALPVRPGRTGVRSFCGDDTGSLCVNLDGTPYRGGGRPMPARL